MNERKLEINTLRGLACLLLVAYHVVGATRYSGLLIDGGWLRELNDYLAYLRMPLFTVLSGFVYAARPYSGRPGSFLLGKARRLLVPMLFVGTVFAVVQELVPGSNAQVENWYLLHIIPVGHFWFIESLFIVFLVILPLERMNLLSYNGTFILVFSVSLLLYLFFPLTKLFSISGATYLLPYFLFGLWCGRFKVIEAIPKAGVWSVACVALVCLAWLGDAGFSKRSIFAITIGILGCAVLLGSRLNVQLFAWVGEYSYTIYLLHIFFTAASRILLSRLGVESIYVLFVSGCLAGLFGPILVEYALGRFYLFKLLVSGQSLKSKSVLADPVKPAIDRH